MVGRLRSGLPGNYPPRRCRVKAADSEGTGQRLENRSKPGWCKGLTDYLEASDAVVPEGWLEPTELTGGAAAGGERGGGGGPADTFLATEREQLRLD